MKDKVSDFLLKRLSDWGIKRIYGFPGEFLPKEGQARGVQIDIDGRMLSIRYPMEVNLMGDSAETLRALTPFLERKKDRSWRKDIEKETNEWWKVLEARAMQGADPINPQRVFWELSPRLPDNCVLSSDSGRERNHSADNQRCGGHDPAAQREEVKEVYSDFYFQ